jgi:site-specific DNA-methyltransferase (adenine-specific)
MGDFMVYTDNGKPGRTVEWGTPQDIFDKLDEEFHFTLDPCASSTNHKCQRYFTKETDGLKQDWSKDRVFMNPPYGRGEHGIAAWVKKAYEESLKGALVVCLLPTNTDTAWWQDYVMKAWPDGVRFPRGRVNFVDEYGEVSQNSNHSSSFVIFRPKTSEVRAATEKKTIHVDAGDLDVDQATELLENLVGFLNQYGTWHEYYQRVHANVDKGHVHVWRLQEIEHTSSGPKNAAYSLMAFCPECWQNMYVYFEGFNGVGEKFDYLAKRTGGLFDWLQVGQRYERTLVEAFPGDD